MMWKTRSPVLVKRRGQRNPHLEMTMNFMRECLSKKPPSLRRGLHSFISPVLVGPATFAPKWNVQLAEGGNAQVGDNIARLQRDLFDPARVLVE